eukprot:TRINITY_DN16385_c0_g1_i1.p1 TRINITY_DN16385_c0_g1~~TRINITY_DN16385_c0_g1_i1.p1  ORF type:complete len:128 (+),score=41.73 TRINITY_DN16385_c0_g1_i1:146-529(+)
MLRSLVGSEMCIRDSINAEYGVRNDQAMSGVQIDAATLHAAHAQIGEHCKAANKAFMECKASNAHPAACLKQGDDVTKCAIALLSKLSVCQDKLEAFSTCLDKNNRNLNKCRAAQTAFDECAKRVLN